jgi:hypothetical protein
MKITQFEALYWPDFAKKTKYISVCHQKLVYLQSILERNLKYI